MTTCKKSTDKWVFWAIRWLRRSLCYASLEIAPQSLIRDNNGSLVNHHKYLFSCGIPIFWFENHSIRFATIFGHTSDTPCHSFGLITIGSVVFVNAHGFFCQKDGAATHFTLVVFFVKLFWRDFASFGAVFGPTVVVLVCCETAFHYITLMKMPINMVTIKPVSASM